MDLLNLDDSINEVGNQYTDDSNYTHIDVYESEDENVPGKTVAIVCRDTKKVFYIDNLYRNSVYVSNSINEVLKELDNE